MVYVNILFIILTEWTYLARVIILDPTRSKNEYWFILQGRFAGNRS